MCSASLKKKPQTKTTYLVSVKSTFILLTVTFCITFNGQNGSYRKGQDVCMCTQAWIKLVHDRIHCWAVTNLVMNF